MPSCKVLFGNVLYKQLVFVVVVVVVVIAVFVVAVVGVAVIVSVLLSVFHYLRYPNIFSQSQNYQVTSQEPTFSS